jgi:hypothetical protein
MALAVSAGVDGEPLGEGICLWPNFRSGGSSADQENNTAADESSSISWPTGQSATKFLPFTRDNSWSRNLLGEDQSVEMTCFPCGLCAYSTTRESSLRRHRAVKHVRGRDVPAQHLLGASCQQEVDPGSICQQQLGLNQPEMRLEPLVELTVGSYTEQHVGRAKSTLVKFGRSTGCSRVERQSTALQCGIPMENPSSLKRYGRGRGSRGPELKQTGGVRRAGDQRGVVLSIVRTKVVLPRGHQQHRPPSDDYTFKCQTCPFATNQSLFLAKHVARHHKDK